MNEVVLDASVLIKWFKATGEQQVQSALSLYHQFSQGTCAGSSAPVSELLNAAGRRWGWDAPRLERFAADLDLLGLQVRQPSLARIAQWCSRGLTAYDACYVALAQEQRTVVVTDDQQIIAVAGALARPL